MKKKRFGENMNDEKMNEMTNNILMLPPFFQRVVSSKERKSKPPIYYQVIDMLEREGDLPISVIGNRLFMSRPNMTWNIDKLVADGMVKRVADKKDRRVTRISVTPDGREFHKKSHEQVNKNIKINLAHLSDKEFEELYHCMKTIKKVLLKIQDI